MLKQTYLLNLICVLFISILMGCSEDPNRKGSDGSTPFEKAIAKGDVVNVKRLIDKGANINLNSRNNLSPLMSATQRGYFEIVKLLVEKGANVDNIDDYGVSALTGSVMDNQTTIVQYLLEKGANPNGVMPNQPVRPLFIAVDSHHTEIVKILLDKGADPNLEGITSGINKGKTVMSVAKKKNYTDIIELLKKAGAKE